MLGIVGTVPDLQLPLIHGQIRRVGTRLVLKGRSVPIQRGTPALLAAALKASEYIAGPEIYAFLVGDTGQGDGSRKLYSFLAKHLSEFDFQALAFHYLQPDVDWHNRVLYAVEEMKRRPFLIADAGFMYAVKMSGQASSYDFFTPDVGELAFLADEQAPHPVYTRGFILHRTDRASELITLAYRNRNAARHLLVKGQTDRIVSEGRIVETVDVPSNAAMEAIGGTGDTLTGLLALLCGADFGPVRSAELAARINRWAGCVGDITPASQILELIENIPVGISSTTDIRR